MVTLCFIWRVPELIDDAQNARLMLHLSQEVHHYSTREMRKEFSEKYYATEGVSKSILRCIYKNLTDDSSSAPTLLQGDVDERVAKAVLAVENPDIILDLRSLNGKPKSALLILIVSGLSCHHF